MARRAVYRHRVRVSDRYIRAAESWLDGGGKVEDVPVVEQSPGTAVQLSKDCELLPETKEAFVYAAMVSLMLRRLGHPW